MLKTFAISMVKDEADVIEATVTRMAAQVDGLIVADNGSTDGTREILTNLARHLDFWLIADRDPAYYQSRKMSRLAGYAAEKGADWVIPFDADEVWCSPHGRIADVFAERGGAAIAPALLYDHVPTAADIGGSPVESIGWRRTTAAPLPKVACRATLPVTVEQGNHGAHYETEAAHGLLEVRHFPYRSVEQMVRKARNGAAAYAATDLPEDVGKHWRDYGRLTDEQIGDVFREHFWCADPEASDLIFDPVP